MSWFFRGTGYGSKHLSHGEREGPMAEPWEGEGVRSCWARRRNAGSPSQPASRWRGAVTPHLPTPCGRGPLPLPLGEVSWRLPPEHSAHEGEEGRGVGSGLGAPLGVPLDSAPRGAIRPGGDGLDEAVGGRGFDGQAVTQAADGLVVDRIDRQLVAAIGVLQDPARGQGDLVAKGEDVVQRRALRSVVVGEAASESPAEGDVDLLEAPADADERPLEVRQRLDEGRGHG